MMQENEPSSEAGILLGLPADEDDESQIPESAPPPDEDQDEGTTEDEPVEEPTAFTVKELAEKLQVEPGALYDGLEIDVGDGEKLSLGTFKDKAKDLHRAERMLADAEIARQEAENESMKRRRELEQFAQNIGRQPSEDELKAIREQNDTWVEEQNALAVQAITGWDDPAVQKAESGKVAELLTDYGFHPAEIETLIDHRFVKLIRDHAVLKGRIDKAKKAEVGATKRPAGKRKRRAAVTDIQRAKEAHSAGKLPTNSLAAALIADGLKDNG